MFGRWNAAVETVETVAEKTLNFNYKKGKTLTKNSSTYLLFLLFFFSLQS